MNCPHCGENLPNNAQYCSNCGKELSYHDPYAQHIDRDYDYDEEYDEEEEEEEEESGKSKNRKLIVVLVILSLLLIFSIGLNVYQVLQGKKNDDKPVTTKPTVQNSSVTPASSSQAPTSSQSTPVSSQTPSQSGVQSSGASSGGIVAGKSYRVNTANDDLNIRSGPSSSNEIVGRVPKGTVLVVKEVASSWAKIEYKGVTGYVSTDYLTPVQ